MQTVPRDLRGKIVKALRVEAGENQTEYGEHIGVNRRTVCNWERGGFGVCNPRWNKVLRHAKLSNAGALAFYNGVLAKKKQEEVDYQERQRQVNSARNEPLVRLKTPRLRPQWIMDVRVPNRILGGDSAGELVTVKHLAAKVLEAPYIGVTDEYRLMIDRFLKRCQQDNLLAELPASGAVVENIETQLI